MATFITNQNTKTLNKRLSELIPATQELKILTAFFYFSGFRVLYENLKKNPETQLKILVGLNVDKTNRGLVEVSAEENNQSRNEKVLDYLFSIKKSLTSEDLDNKEVYREAKYFLELIRKQKLVIRKTYNPNHAKVYIFITKKDQPIRKITIIGSSNLTKAGLLEQDELNVELPEIYTEKIEEYFDNLWENSIEITEKDEIRQKIIKIIEDQSFLKEITPFQAFVLVLKNYLDYYKHKDLSLRLFEILKKNGYRTYNYQIDAIKQALPIIEEKNGVILADVVGLGKTVMACAIAKELRKPGIIICPPGLKGNPKSADDGGWNMYRRQFGLNDWEVWSLGDLEKLQKEIRKMNDVEVIIVDEAHRFRNEDTQSYEYLKNICRGKKVILLSATPFNNRPSDILSLIKLFLPPKRSYITLYENLADKFAYFQGQFKKLGYILKIHKSSDKFSRKYKQAISYYKSVFKEEIDELDEDAIKNVKNKVKYIAKQIRSIIETITIRRNRLDLLKNPRYRGEIKNISKVEDPKEWFFELTKEQSEFYDKVVGKYFADPEDGGVFKGAIYRPFLYEKGLYGKDIKEDKLSLEENREFIQQVNLYDFMRRLLVKRFESSFGAFKQSIENFKKVTQSASNFIEKHNLFILDRNLILRLEEMDEDEVEEELLKYEQKLIEKVRPKYDKIYRLENFKQKEEFLAHIKSDLKLFDDILKELNELSLLDHDPKAFSLISNLKTLFKRNLSEKPKRKVIIFSEYLDTVKYLKNILLSHFDNVLVVDKNLNNNLIKEILENFDASYKIQKDNYDILLATDKLSEGFNLNRAGMIINYDIPWNPVRVIQRLGRINRIGKKVFDSLYIVNFFPTEKGADLIKSREIASQKMFLIHNTLGEDSKIFDPDEEPKASKLYSKLMQNPETLEEENFYTKIYNLLEEITKKYPEVLKDLENMPPRVKVAKKGDKNELFVFIRKNRQVYVRSVNYKTGEVDDTTLEGVFEKIKCLVDEKPLEWDTDEFWTAYEKALKTKKNYTIAPSEQSLERQALNVLDTIRAQKIDLDEDLLKFIRNLREDIVSFGTLPKTTLRTIANLPLKDPINLKENLYNLAKNLGGVDYLNKEKAQAKKLKKEIIVAIENKKL
ncbi:MAG: ATP-dependent helicase [Patescibacteria group bacterium]|nr:MAG: ATP-dependent helicase [Patescibacteria group bacterium]